MFFETRLTPGNFIETVSSNHLSKVGISIATYILRLVNLAELIQNNGLEGPIAGNFIRKRIKWRDKSPSLALGWKAFVQLSFVTRWNIFITTNRKLKGLTI